MDYRLKTTHRKPVVGGRGSVLLLVLLAALTSSTRHVAAEQQADTSAVSATSKPSNPTQALSRELLVHRRYLRWPTDSNVSPNQVSVTTGDKTIASLQSNLSAALNSDGGGSANEIDVRAWIGAVLKFTVQHDEADSQVAQQWLDGVTQTNAKLTSATHGSESQQAAASEAPAGKQDQVSFAHQIRPILSENCFACHGPNDENELTSLKLSDREIAVELDAIVPGDAAASELLARVTSDEPGVRMPPEASHKKPLTNEQVDLLRKWIDQGAKYEKHWAFVPPKAKPPAAAGGRHPIRNPIDAFVFEKLAEKGLAPNFDGEPYRLIRRVALDLTGLPPTAEQVRRYCDNPTDEVYAAIVDELLASPRYSEQWARHWLDSVRYADTHGIHIDNYRSIWPYRDWVIRAFEQNMPFDQFTIEQLAGDMLPGATNAQHIASGYNRCLPTTGEGGSIEAEVASNNANDRTATTFAIWQGLTVGCAACHDHKFDPLSQKEYYQLTAFFRNNTMNALDGNSATHPPTLEAPNPVQSARRETLRTQRTELAKQIAAEEKVWNESLGKTPLLDQWRKIREPNQVAVGATRTIESKFSVTPGGTHIPKAPFVDGLFGKVAEISKQHAIGFNVDVVPDIRQGFGFGGFVKCPEEARGTLWSHRFCDPNSNGWEVSLNEKNFRIYMDDQRSNWKLDLQSQSDITDGKWHHVFVIYHPAKRMRPVTVLVDGKPDAYQFALSSDRKLGRNASLVSDAQLYFGRRDRKESGSPAELTGAVLIENFRYFDQPVEVSDVLSMRLEKANQAPDALSAVTDNAPPDDVSEGATEAEIDPAKLPEAHQQLITERFQQQVAPKLHALTVQQADIEAELFKLKQEIPVSLVMQEKKNSTPTAHVLARGDYAAKGEKVAADVPAILPPLNPDSPKDRLGLAAWLASPENPLTARVVANRYWHYLFGTGIVETTEDFGATGSLPSHPELLDWLAEDFVAHDWDVKQLLRTMVTSSTYRQSQVVSAEKSQLDPENRLLSRGPRIRLDGEQLRDMALMNSGLLADERGGPPVRPYQPENVWRVVAMPSSNTKHYKPDKGEALYRRSLYTFWKRTAAPPSMTLLNAPDRDVFCVRRERTNTPLQAFVLLNDPQFVEAARNVAQRAMQHSGGDSYDTITYIGELFLCRDFSEEEYYLLEATQMAAYRHFKASPEKAAALLAVGESAYDSSLDPAWLTAYTVVASQIMNLDEALTK